MVHTARRLLSVALLAWVLASSAVAQAQALPPGSSASDSIARLPLTQSFARDEGGEEVPAPFPSTTPGGDIEPELLKSLPRPPDQPRSLFDPPPPAVPPIELERPYFEYDPILDPPQWHRPGWFTNADVAVIKPHVSNDMFDLVTTGLGRTSVVQLGSARLDGTVAPRLEVGYRLPSGFGEISLSDRFFVTQGTGPFAGADGPATRTTRFNVNFSDLDYGSSEYTPFPLWRLRFRGGLRIAETYFTSQVDQPFAQAASGSFFTRGETNRTTAFGPHFGVEVQRRLARPGLTLVNSVDVADMFTRIRQKFFVTSTVPAPGGFDRGTVVDHFLQINPVLTAQIGLNWQPPTWRNNSLYLGYYGQFWYQFATNSSVAVGPFGAAVPTHFDNQGLRLQWSWNY